MNAPLSSDSVVQSQLDLLLGEVATAFGQNDVDVLSWYGPIAFGVDTAIQRLVERRRNVDKSQHLVFLLTTEGGIVEVVQRVVPTIRHHYRKSVAFVIPDYAYSAGTVLALSGDAIYMDYHSRLGPVDPQVLRGDRYVPALGYCERYDDLIKRSRKTMLTDAEIAVLIGSFNQAELYEFEQARELSITLLRDWLVEYKFKDWNTTQTRGVPVTPQMKTLRARAIARTLNNTAKWHSHASGISAEVLRDELKLHIDDLDANPELKLAVTNYQTLLEDYMARTGQGGGVVHMRGEFLPYHVHQ